MSTHTAISWEAFLAAGADGQRWEWVDGEIVYMTPVGFWHEIVLTRLLASLMEYTKIHPEWVCVASNAAYTMVSDNLRLPDASLTRKDRFRGGQFPSGQADRSLPYFTAPEPLLISRLAEFSLDLNALFAQ